MIQLKTPKDIKKIAYSGHLLADIVKKLVRQVKPGVTTLAIDTLAETMIRDCGGTPAFKYYQSHPDDPPFPSTICASVNNELVHTPASERQLGQGDIFTIDIGMEYEGLFTDMAVTVPVGSIVKEAKKLLKVTRESLARGIKAARPGNFVHDISRAVQEYVEDNGFSLNRVLVGHGVGYAVHEDPRIPNFIAPHQPSIPLVVGMVLAIEPMVNVGTDKVTTLDDGWTVVTADGKLCAHFEHTVAVTERGPVVLTN
ncbi:type I methionyl aminopeptidase [Candidatus Falkowbacteria bacterium]|nr:type I methionyl aminopeptidase [Candidatus Falkowbacteria bacterium]